MELKAAGRSDGDAVSALLRDYLRELDAYRGLSGQTAGSGDYLYLNAYWSEAGRHAFIIRSGGRLVGFALARGPASTGSTAYELAEFYVEPDSRRRGLGRRAVVRLWEHLPGDWELQVHSQNAGAVRFWRSCIRSVTGEPPQVREVQTKDGARLHFSFRVRNAP